MDFGNLREVLPLGIEKRVELILGNQLFRTFNYDQNGILVNVYDGESQMRTYETLSIIINPVLSDDYL